MVENVGIFEDFLGVPPLPIFVPPKLSILYPHTFSVHILVKCFVWSVALYGTETWTLRRNEQKRLEAFEMWIWRRMERVKWTDKIKIAVALERLGEGIIMLKLIKEKKIN